MGKYYKKKYYRGNRDKYSVEQTTIDGTLTAGTTSSFVVVPAATFQGMRKVKHLTVSLTALDAEALAGCLWALVYVPAGTVAGGLSTTSGAPMYEPNQFVMNGGMFDFNAGPVRVHSPVSRNLNSGDAIYLLVQGFQGTLGSSSIRGVVRYAITLQ